MRWLLLLVATVAATTGSTVTEDPQVLAQRIVDTEQECEHLKNLATIKTEYATLQDACQASLLMDSYAYIDQNNVNQDGSQETFTVTTSKGQDTVKMPPKVSAEELQAMLKSYKEKKALDGKRSSKQAQEVVDQQVLCELQESTGEDECSKKLNCLKDKFMADQHLALKDNLETFPITYKGKKAMIASPPDADRTETCRSYALTTPKGEESAEKNNGNGENEFSELDTVANETPKYKVSGNKMVTKSLGDDNPLMGMAVSAITKSLAGDSAGAANGLTNQVMGMAAPHIGGMLTRNIISKIGKNSPLALMNPTHVNTLMKLAKNGFRSKEQRERINKSDLKSAVEIITKTAVHFTILALRARQAGKKDTQKKKGLAKFLETLEVAIIDAVAASVVDYIVDVLIPDEDDFPTPTAPPAKGGFFSTLSNLATSSLNTPPAKGASVSKAADDTPSPMVNLAKGLAAQFLKTALSSNNK